MKKNDYLKKPTINVKHTQILAKKFKINLSGYDADEVDQFLDQIIEDQKNYEEHFDYLNDMLQDKNNLINDKDEEIHLLQIKVSGYEDQLERASKATKKEYVIEEIEGIKGQLEELQSNSSKKEKKKLDKKNKK